MKLTVIETPLEGVLLIDTHFMRDERGFFIESWHQRDYAAAGLAVTFVQDNHSRSERGVLRGLHYQDMSAPLGKLIRCTRGAIFDVAVDLRVDSPTFGQWTSAELTEENKRQIYVPPGFAHGFEALSDGTEVQYKQTGFYMPDAEGTVAWNDPEIGITWPIASPTLSARDRNGSSLAEYRRTPAFKV
jgi:dTDP-4-dehydrorhamnose 3,5-epimerase